MKTHPFAYGVDLGWMTQLEREGYHWVDDNKNRIDPLDAAIACGADSIRLRLFVNPPETAYWAKRENETCMLGLCDTQSVIEIARRAADKGLRLMLDLHYSDHFADPQFQDIPAAWAGLDAEALADKVYDYTQETMQAFRDAGLTPEWVQVGNEINPGILLPMGSLEEHPADLVTFLTRGYEAVKAVFPETLVITHLAMVCNVDWTERFFDNFFEHGGKTDILGFSHYPYWYNMESGKESYDEPLQYYLERYKTRYGRPVMIVEVGGAQTDPDGTYDLVADAIAALHKVAEGRGLGVFYWEPEAALEALPDHYPLCAAELTGDHEIHYTRAITAYRDDPAAGSKAGE